MQLSLADLITKVVEAERRLNLSEDNLDWITSPEITALIRALVELKGYYITHDGDTTSIDFRVLHSYFNVERKVQLILRSPKYVDKFVPASRLLEALEGIIDDLIRQGYRQVYPDIYKSFEDEYLDEDERFDDNFREAKD